MDKNTSISEIIVYAILSCLGFTRTGSPSIDKEAKVFPKGTYKKASSAIDVKANKLPFHRERGWKNNAGIYRGYFRCRFGAFKGEIEERANEEYKFYILNPPTEVLIGAHKACFTSTGNGRFHIHFGINSNNLDSGIMAVERLLSQSLQRR
ncbi:MAG: hypothetical protein CV087_05590 [Candidatus Brocadia sp. WS118]|nr:MAG: hypothetical protein CV087_05590 [Candidatus Brocadia sp. WS118]